MTKSQLNILELESQEMRFTICSFNAELSGAKKMLAENQTLVGLVTLLSKLNSINKQPSLLAEDIFYAMAQAVMTKASLEAIYLGGVLVLGGLLASLGINDNNIMFGVPNCIPSPSNLRYVVKKSLEDTFMKISVFVCNYPCRI